MSALIRYNKPDAPSLQTGELPSLVGLASEINKLFDTITNLMKEIDRLTTELAKEARRADSWVKAARELAQSMGFDADENKGSLADWKFITAELEAMTAERDALRKDAERYRWLRHGDNDEVVLREAAELDGTYCYLPRNEELDAEIDAATGSKT